MKNAHIAVISVPILSMMNLTLPLVPVLVRRGHRVTYAVSEAYSSRVEAIGAEVVKYRFGAVTTKVLEEDRNSYCRIAINTIAAVTPRYEAQRPNLLIYDFVSLAGPILAKTWNVPAVRVNGCYAFTKPLFERQIRDDDFRQKILEASGRADEFLESHGVPSDFIFHREKLNIFPFPRDFEPCESAIDDTCWHAGRCAGEQSGIGEWRNRHRHRGPVVLIAPSISYLQGMDYFRTCIAAVSRLECHVVLCVSDDFDVPALGPLPANLEIVQRTSYTKILPHVSLVVCMGGMGTTSEAAYYGVPIVATSVGKPELEMLADNQIKLGIGVHLRGADLDAETLRQACVHALESPVIARNVRELQRRVRRQAGAEETVNRIEDYLEESAHSSRERVSFATSAS